MHSVTCIAPVNIAVVKYWGKRNEELILPVNDSISGTLSTDQLCAKTTIVAASSFTEDKMWLNGTEVDIPSNVRLIRCMKLCKFSTAGLLGKPAQPIKPFQSFHSTVKQIAENKSNKKSILAYKLHICSENNFPTAAGLASSAAGYACFVYTLASLYGIDNEELTAIGRLGSGSACRSFHGGFVRWKAGELVDGSDSIAVQVAPVSHWPEMHVLILVVSDTKKKVGSSLGMKLATENSELLKYRASVCVPKRITDIEKAIADRDYPTFGELTMRDSNQFHAVCLDTYPPCVYMNDTSHTIANFVHVYNAHYQGVRAAYTFDAGPNVCVYLLENEVERFLSTLNALFPNNQLPHEEYVRGIPIQHTTSSDSGVQEIAAKIDGSENAFKYIIHTKLGDGPKRLNDSESLLNADGLPWNQ